MGAAPPVVTVVVPTYRRPESVACTLTELSAQRAAFSWDVVVVDNDATGSAARAVDAARAAGLDVRYAVEPRTGVAHARNAGVAAAAAGTVAFLDDDVVPRPGWLSAVVEPVLTGRAAAAGGPVVLDPDVDRPRWFTEAGLGGYLSGFSLGATPRDVEPGEILLTANLAIRRDVLEAVGGFDPTYGPRGGVQLVADDAHLVRELHRRGDRVAYVPDAVVQHALPAERLTRTYLLRRAYLQGRSDWLLERTEHQGRRMGGARVAAVYGTGWLRAQLRERRREGVADRAVRFHLATDLVRFAGTMREAMRPSR